MILPDLFGDVVAPSVKVGDRSFRSLPVSVLIHAAVVAATVLVALTSADLLPTPPAVMAFVAPMMPPSPPPPPPPRTAPVPAARAALPGTNPAAAPIEAPAEIRPETGLELPVAGVPGGVEGGIPGGIAGEGVVVVPEAPPPPAPPPPEAPIRIGGNIRPPTKIRDVPPAYPQLAIQARVQGVVIVEADISAAGKVTGARILRSIRLLDQAALDAVRQWEYTPTLLNGQPRAVVMVVTVNFFLTAPGGASQ